MANNNLLSGLAGFAQGFAPSYVNSSNMRAQLLAQLEEEKRRRMQQESAESQRFLNMVPGLTLPEVTSGADFMGQTVDEPAMRARALQAAEMSDWTPNTSDWPVAKGMEEVGPNSPVLSAREQELIPGAQVASKAKRIFSRGAGTPKNPGVAISRALRDLHSTLKTRMGARYGIRPYAYLPDDIASVTSSVAAELGIEDPKKLPPQVKDAILKRMSGQAELK